MQKRRYEILLPLTNNDGQPINSEKFRQTREELLARFSGISMLPGTVRGTWVHEGLRYEDESMRFSIDVEDTNENREFFANL